MPDPLGLIGATPAAGRIAFPAGPRPAGGGTGFREALAAEIEKVNRLQQDATRAVEDLAAGRRDDVEGVLAATHKADIAFRLLVQVRNKVMEACDAVKQIRV